MVFGCVDVETSDRRKVEQAYRRGFDEGANYGTDTE
jgi:hypothetical protein